MADYIIGNIEVTDPAAYEGYRRAVPAIIAAHGGRYLVRGGAVECLEGDGPWNRIVVLEFPDRARAEAFYRSPEYQAVLPGRLKHSRGTLCIVEGV